jgi:hypothetical protein
MPQFLNGHSSELKDVPKAVHREARILHRLSLTPEYREALNPVLLRCVRHVLPLSGHAAEVTQMIEALEAWLKLPADVQQRDHERWFEEPRTETLRAPWDCVLRLTAGFTPLVQSDAATTAGHELFWSMIGYRTGLNGTEMTYLRAAMALIHAGRDPAELESIIAAVFPKELRERPPHHKLNVTWREQAKIHAEIVEPSDEPGPIFRAERSIQAMNSVLGFENIRVLLDDFHYGMQPSVELRVCGPRMPHRIGATYPEERFDTTLPEHTQGYPPGTGFSDGTEGTYCHDGWAWI